MMPNAATAPGERRQIYNPVQRDTATFIETSAQSGGQRTLIEIEVAPGGGTTPHYHLSYDEHFEVIQGALQVTTGGVRHTLGPGGKAVALRNTLHNFHNATDTPTTFLVELRPGSEGFEKALNVAYGLARDGLVRDNGLPRNPLHLALLFEWGEGRVPGVATVLAPLFRLLAWEARRWGVDQSLEARYCP
jgi:quercetin dioxygenase-like cupin family protein